ncbi:DEAD 2 domain-containing protein [Paenibacillus alvei TS-15]|uniref:DEAD 2 domain-containing protein n=1 Tax=Paenibacillus alvei TS-15 TaxID=1117108 RepID=S9SNI0_PAEAL|nr:ATP-dependent DNA helicase [Paenibacillus alvei]EPY06279.1 DEAD 2 domain-containing protein [Paenibacillus alvei TS-15]
MKDQVKIAVRPLVEYVYRSGDLDSGFRAGTALTEGTKAHQQVQRTYGEADQKEVYLSAEIPCGDLLFVIDGRCDGFLVEEDGSVVIDEIKSTSGEIPQTLEDTYPVHWAQAKCYAYMYAREHEPARMKIQLTYVQVVTGEQRRFQQEAVFADLELFVRDVVENYASYALMLREHRISRDRSISGLEFPFTNYRAGQRKLAGAVYKVIEEGVKLFAKAPTGIGKTISTTFPAVKAMGTGQLEQFFYLTAKTTTRTAAEETFSLMQSQGLQMHTVTITAKEKICFQDQVSCRKEDCPFADGYYDRINEAVLDILTNELLITRQIIEQYARKHRVCPFEFSLDLAYAADAVICDYNYIFDPRISLKRMFAERKSRTALLIDEAHNLVDRAREMYSATLNKGDFLSLQREYKELNAEVHKAAKAVNAFFIQLRKESDGNAQITQEVPVQLVERAEAFILAAEEELGSRQDTQQSQSLMQAYFATQNFVRISKLYDERYVTYAEISSREVSMKLFCLDPSHLLREMGKGFRSHIFFSATLTPMSYFRDMLGASPEEDYTLSLPSPFFREQLGVQIEPLSTRYHDREGTKLELVRRLGQMITDRPGNYLFFFPSYAYMNLIYEAFAAAHAEDANLRLLLQRGDMAEEERESFLSAFDADNEGVLIGFAVMGGVFSEGIDLVGDRLTGVAIVGVGLPQIGLERDIIRDYFNSQGKNGFDYAYVYPGMNKVLQAGGRLIRSETDQGELLLIDDRYLHPHYAALLPDEWK